ncbi:U3 snoRNP protein [Thecaphora frezii]
MPGVKRKPPSNHAPHHGTCHTHHDQPPARPHRIHIMSDHDMHRGFQHTEPQLHHQDRGFPDLDDADHTDAEARPSQKRSKTSALYALPTTEEVQGLKQTQELFKSNVFKLKIDEMLPEVRPAFGKAGALELVLRRLHTLFESLQPIEPLPVAQALDRLQKRSKRALNVPFPDPVPKGDAPYKLGFDKPAGMHLVGSWPLKSTAKKPDGIDVDVAVVMPSSLFQDKDHLNFRYFYKRAFYLAVLADAIRSHRDTTGVEASYQLLDADPRRSVLVLRPVHDRSDTDFSKLKACIRIHLAHEPDLFKVGRLSPARNSVRVGSADDEGAKELAPTPRYNAAILMDELQLAHLVYLHTTAKDCPAFADACLLLKTWAFQRGFGAGARQQRRQVAGTGSIRYILTMILAHLLHGEEKVRGQSGCAKLAMGFSSYQLFRGVIDWLAHHDFQAQPVFMKPMPSAGLVSRSDKIPRHDFTAVFDRVLVDPSGTLNLFSFLPTGSLDLLQFEAKRTLAMLDDSTSDHFETLFLQDRTAPVFTYDEVATLSLPSASASGGRGKGEAEENALKRADFGNSYQASMIKVSSTASRALRGRAQFVALSHATSGGLMDAWDLGAPRPTSLVEAEIGVVLDPEQAWRMVEHGPRSEDKAAADEFRAFWGERAELRRFKDGRILESVVWPTPTIASRWAIPRRILAYALQRHHGIGEAQVSFLSDKFDGLVEMESSLARRAHVVSVEEKGFQLVQSAFDGLVKELRAIEDLPLSLNSIVGCSPGLRGTSTFVPGPLSLDGLGSRVPDAASYLPVQEVVVTFEGSGRWPSELEAFQAMKAAFCEKMGDALSQRIEGCQCRVVFEARSNPLQDQCALEVILPSGFAFHIRIQHERETAIADRILSDRFESAALKKKAKAASQLWHRRFVVAPRHHRMVAAVGHKFVSFGGAVRLTKRWLRAQMLGRHLVSDEAIELVAAAAYLLPDEGAPASSVAGFLRIVRLLATWRWKEEPLLVPLQTAASAPEGTERFSFPTELRVAAEDKFTAARAADPAMSNRAWYIATEVDVDGLDFGRQGPFAGGADGIRKLAKAAVALWMQGGAALERYQVKGMFVPALEHYDFVIRLRREVLGRYSHNVEADKAVWMKQTKSKYANLLDEGEVKESVLGPVARPGFEAGEAFIKVLMTHYADTFRLFYDDEGGCVVGGVWNPSLERPRQFKVALGFSSRPAEEAKANANVALNRNAILAEIQRIGEGVVESIDVRS